MVLNLKTINTENFSQLNNLKFKNINVYDIEAYPNYFLICYTSISAEDKIISKKEDLEINYIDSREDDFAQQIYELFKFNLNDLTLWIGYNNTAYDDKIIAYIAKHRAEAADKDKFLKDLKNLSDSIINNSKVEEKIWINFSSVDLIKEIKVFGKKSINNLSLKDIELNLGMEIEKEESQSFNENVKDFEHVIKYCKHDVWATAVIAMMSFDDNFYNVSNVFNKLFLYDLYMTEQIENLYLTEDDWKYKQLFFRINMSLPSLAAEYFAKEKKDELFFVTNNEIKIIKPKMPKALEIYEKRKKDVFCKINNFTIAGKEISFGDGGIHTANNNELKFYRNVYNFDVTSYYPSFLEKLKDIANIDLEKYKQIKAERIELKKKKDNISQAKQTAYKLALNSLTGKFNEKREYNAFYNPSVYLSITNTCQILLVDLTERLSNHINLVQLNTDGIAFTVKENSNIEDIRKIIRTWENDFGFALEESFFTKFFERSVNEYLAVTDTGKIKVAGKTFANFKTHGGEIGFTDPIANILYNAFARAENNNFDEIVKLICETVNELIDNKEYQQLQFNLKATATEKDKMIRNTDKEIDSRTKGTRVFLTKNGNLSAAKFKFLRRRKGKGKETIKLTFNMFQNDLENCNLNLSKEKYILMSVLELSKMYSEFKRTSIESKFEDFDELVNYLKNLECCKKYEFESISKI
jgi:putative phage DNA polymerase